MGNVETFRGPIGPERLGVTLIHEHVFVRNFELEVNRPDAEWDASDAVESAIRYFMNLHDLGVQTVVDLTVPGLGRDVALVSQVAAQVPINLVAATGWYTPNVLPPYFRYYGPERPYGGDEPLIDLFLRDIRDGISGSAVKAGMIKVMTDEEGFTPDVNRVMSAAATAHHETGAAITTHSHPASRNGLGQQSFLVQRGVDPQRIVIGHCGDTRDLDYLKVLMDGGTTIGMDRFGMEHVLPDEQRVSTVVALIELGYADRMVLSHDAAVYSHITPPSWRAEHAPNWRMDNLPSRILPKLTEAGVSAETIEQMMVINPRRLLERTS